MCASSRPSARGVPTLRARDTLFFGDLGMVSIDAVMLAETLEQRYGRKFPSPEFLAELGRRGAQDLEVGELVQFLSGHLGEGTGS